MNSSMRYIDLEGLSPSQIIQKYEELLFQRENILKSLSNQLNESQAKYIEVSETIEQLSNRNKELNEMKLKCDKTLKQQRTDKDLLFIKLNNLISENDKLTNPPKEKKLPKPSNPPIPITKKKEKDSKDNIINNSNNLRLELKREEINKEPTPKKEKEINKKEAIKIQNDNKPPQEQKEIKKVSNGEKKDNENLTDEKIVIEDKEKEKGEEKKEEEKKSENEKDVKDKIEEKGEQKNEIKDEQKNESKDEDKKEEKEEEKNESKEEDKKENDNKINENEEEENKSKSEKKVIVVNPEEYLNRRKKKKHNKNKNSKKLLSEKISYEPVFK